MLVVFVFRSSHLSIAFLFVTVSLTVRIVAVGLCAVCALAEERSIRLHIVLERERSLRSFQGGCRDGKAGRTPRFREGATDDDRSIELVHKSESVLALA